MNGNSKTYSNINMEKSGRKIQQFITENGYDVKWIQEYLHLSCPQPIYRWFKGKILPSVDHLFMLSQLFGVHMEDFLVSKSTFIECDVEYLAEEGMEQRMIFYYQQLLRKIA
ncbi:MAG: helix-turn-helix domain-containing protein [Lachnospiraceae bacterium]|nr:helix-turn-helix domain-containing protein [Lachnospiraceae bacterium]